MTKQKTTSGTTPLIDSADESQRERARDLVRRYLGEAHATETSLVTNLTAHISMTPQGTYRTILERHREETRQQAQAIQRRLDELGGGAGILGTVTGLAESIVGQALVMAKGPIDMIRGRGGEEKLLKNAKDECATEALEIATYDALERVARAVGDERTAELAVRHREQEERMLADLREQIPILADKVVLEQVSGIETYDVSKTPAGEAVQRAGDAARDAGDAVREQAEDAGQQAKATARKASGRARSTAKQARKVPGVEQAEGAVRGATTGAEDLPIKDYDRLTAGEVVSKLQDLTQVQLATVAGYEARNRNRSTVLERVRALQGDEPFAGYDDLTAKQIGQRLKDADEQTVTAVRDYEQQHRRRVDVLAATQRELSTR